MVRLCRRLAVSKPLRVSIIILTLFICFKRSIREQVQAIIGTKISGAYTGSGGFSNRTELHKMEAGQTVGSLVFRPSKVTARTASENSTIPSGIKTTSSARDTVFSTASGFHVAHNVSGLCEQGEGYTVDRDRLSPSEAAEYDDGMKSHDINEFLSKKISLHRSIPDPRDELCKTEQYKESLPDTSIIVCFHNEAWSVLLRTIHSVIDRSPAHLVKEIIMVDDFSDKLYLNKNIEDYISKLEKVRLIKMKKREGLIRARLHGASAATGKVLTFLDSHCECAPGWLEPLLYRISQNYTHVVIPYIDAIHKETFKYTHIPTLKSPIGGFTWRLKFIWDKSMDSYSSVIAPRRCPTMAGGIFSIDRAFFEYIGAYDPGMDIWGGENLELSFRIWLCGGSMEMLPCSHVGHIFRHKMPYINGEKDFQAMARNFVRVAEVWLDEYKHYYYERVPYGLGIRNKIDVSSRIQLRKKLQCKSFKWYIENIYPRAYTDEKVVRSGPISIKHGHESVCLEVKLTTDSGNIKIAVKAAPCKKGLIDQQWNFMATGQIRRLDACLAYNDGSKAVNAVDCHDTEPTEDKEWQYGKNKNVYHVWSDRCLELHKNGNTLRMMHCDGNRRQLWKWGTS